MTQQGGNKQASSSAADTSATRHERRKRRRSCPKTFKAFLWMVLVHLIIGFHIIKDYFLNWLFGLLSTERLPCPPLNDDAQWLSRGAFELATMIRNKEITAEQLFEACLRRIDQVNPLVNAVVDGPFVDALNEARSIDERIAAGSISAEEFERKPLLGVPFTIKDSTAAKGRLQTLGLVARKFTRAKQDAECVRLTKEAGGILLATTNIPEVNKWQESRNMVIGQTNNPYDNRRTVGGSSGGEAAAIASCMSPIGLGTDIGGSIRMPAFYCGIFGHKPTVGLINTSGCTMRTGNEPSTMVVAGPMARHCSDLMPLFKIMAGPDNTKALELDEPVDLNKLKFYYIRQSGELRCSVVSGDLQSAMTKAINHFEDLTGERPQKVKLSNTEHSSRMWRYWMTQEPADFNLLLGNGRKLNPFVELARKLIGVSEFTLASIFSLIDSVLPQENEAKVKEFTRKCDEELTNLLGDDGILLYHNTTGAAPFHYLPLINIYNFSYWALFNVLHVPCTQVPLGITADGRPLGIQVVATRNRDRHCLAVAKELERAFGGWKPPFADTNITN